MKNLDLVKLKNDKPYKEFNLIMDMHGIVVELNGDNAGVLFFNPNNVGEYAIINVKIEDLEIDREKIPPEFLKELHLNLSTIISKAKNKIKPIAIKEYSMVELLVEDEKYSRFGIHKGDTGCVMDNNAVQNYVEVDFSGIDKNGNYHGDCISVKIDDLKLIK